MAETAEKQEELASASSQADAVKDVAKTEEVHYGDGK